MTNHQRLWPRIISSVVACVGLAFCYLFYSNVLYPHVEKLPPIDYILIKKKARTLEVYANQSLIKSYSIALGFQPIGHKEHEGDGKTPEGRYRISYKNPKSQSHLSLRLSYPSATDSQNAAAKKLSPGGDIMIHGIGPYMGFVGSLHTWRDWTLGCVAVTNAEIQEIYHAVPQGTVVDILP